MRIFLTGGTGLVGRRLVPELLERGHSVVVLSRDPARGRPLLPPAAEIIGGDPTLPGVWQDRAAGCAAAINLAGQSVGEGRWTAGRKRQIRRSRLGATAHLTEAMAGTTGPAVLVNASATGYYGDTGERAVGEDAQPGHDFLARLALEWEHSALQAEAEQVRVVLLRIGVVLSAAGGALARLLPLYRWGLGGPLGSGSQYFPWIHIDDLVAAIVFVLEQPDLHGPVNAAVPSPPTQKEFARELGRAVGKPAVLPAPAFALRLLLGEKAKMLLSGQRVMPNVLRARGFRFRHHDLEEALADLLGVAPTAGNP